MKEEKGTEFKENIFGKLSLCEREKHYICNNANVVNGILINTKIQTFNACYFKNYLYV